MPDFDSVQNAIQKLGIAAGVSESHGTLCGLLLYNSTMEKWLQHTLDVPHDKRDVLAGEALLVLEQLFDQTRERLNGEDMSLELLLPAESRDLSTRLFELSSWCLGFLYAIGVSGGKLGTLDPYSQECLSDLLEISKLDYHEQTDEDGEVQFAEVSEHVRMSVLMLNETLNPTMPLPTLQ